MGTEQKNAVNIDFGRIERRKRVKRMKRMIVISVAILLLIPILFCFLLLLKINRLERQINTLVQEQFEDSSLVDPSVVYAAETDEDTRNKTDQDSASNVPATDSDNEELVMTPMERKDVEIQEKKVYLTFDDGPGKYTDQLLDILDQYHVKATFFVIGKTDEHSLEMYQRIVNDGHTIGMHSYSHQYSKIYASVKAFDKDLKKISNLIYETTNVRPALYRFPGGSSNTVSKIPMTEFIKELNTQNITYFDWNVVNGDATGKDLTEDQMVENVLNGVAKHSNSIVLMHDTVSRDTTVKSIPKLIEQLEENGYTILPITKYTNTVQHIKAGSVE